MTQDRALEILKTGANVFLTGEPGSGKTHTVNQYIAYLRDHGIEPSITASTGIAATHVGGMTVHAWSGVGIKKVLTEYDLDALSAKEPLVRRLTAAKVLIIDEISMLDGVVFELIERICRILRRRGEPFGGLQVILVGDFFQLPPISVQGEALARFAFQSDVWKSAQMLTCYLSEQHRQEDELYLQTLSSIRRGDIGEHIYSHLETRKVEASNMAMDRNITRLYTHNADVDRMNLDELMKIGERQRVFKMKSSGNERLVETLKKNCLSPEVLELKEGAVVMFTKNNFDAGYVNGTLGTIKGFNDEGKPVVRTKSGKTITAETMEWAIEDGGKVLAKIEQIPLRLAWAITVHKSQGMSLDAAVMDLSRAFEYGQGYVALSRVRTLSGVHLEGINQRALEVHPEILAVDVVFRDHSKDADDTFARLEDAELAKLHENFLTAMGGTLETKKERKVKKGKESVEEKGAKSMKTLDKIREQYPNAYRSWSGEDDAMLTKLYGEGVKRTELSKMFGRNAGAIRSRLVHLGLIEG